MRNGRMMNGTPVADIRPHLGMIRGMIRVGMNHGGEPVARPMFWYRDGRMTPAQPTPYDLDLASFGMERIDARALSMGLEFEARAAEAEAEFDDWLSGDDLPF